MEEVIRNGENGLLVEFFAPDKIAERVIEVLADRPAYAAIRRDARRTIVDQYDLQTICMPAQLKLLEVVYNHRAP